MCTVPEPPFLFAYSPKAIPVTAPWVPSVVDFEALELRVRPVASSLDGPFPSISCWIRRAARVESDNSPSSSDIAAQGTESEPARHQRRCPVNRREGETPEAKARAFRAPFPPSMPSFWRKRKIAQLKCGPKPTFFDPSSRCWFPRLSPNTIAWKDSQVDGRWHVFEQGRPLA